MIHFSGEIDRLACIYQQWLTLLVM